MSVMWVSDRAAERRAQVACSVDVMFEELAKQVCSDIEAANREIPLANYTPIPNNERLEVMGARTVVASFAIGGDAHDRIIGKRGEQTFSAEVVYVEGECRLIESGDYYTVDEFSQLVLDSVFFP